jgi:hypothetical protein
MKSKFNTKQILIVAGVIVGIALVLFLSMSVIPKVLVTLTKASSSGTVTVANSYVIGQKILANADGVDKCVVNVFLLDKNGRGVAGQAVELTGMNNISPVSPITDNTGKMTFEMISKEAKQYKIRAIVKGSELLQTVTVTFR